MCKNHMHTHTHLPTHLHKHTQYWSRTIDISLCLEEGCLYCPDVIPTLSWWVWKSYFRLQQIRAINVEQPIDINYGSSADVFWEFMHVDLLDVVDITLRWTSLKTCECPWTQMPVYRLPPQHATIKTFCPFENNSTGEVDVWCFFSTCICIGKTSIGKLSGAIQSQSDLVL